MAVSTGRLFAGNIGAGNRYEYTVIGDAVNEAARLADLAQTADHRILIFVR
nr:adenylate/guanylate cyclase domain-containing protein [Mycobacterium leprae]